MPDFSSSSQMYLPLWAELETGAMVVTANAHAARGLRQAWTRHQCELGNACWESPPILSWDAWFRQLWDERPYGQEDANNVLLSDLEAVCLWEAIIVESGGEVIDVSASARNAYQAWRSLYEYGMAYASDAWQRSIPQVQSQFQSEDAQIFLAWANLYARRLRDQAWLDEPGVAQRLFTHSLRGSPAAEPRRVIWYGFFHLTPAQEALRQACDRSGQWRILPQFWPAENHERFYTAADDIFAEARAAAVWARKFLDENPAARIAILAPDLAPYRRMLERELLQTLAPDQLLHPSDSRGRPYAISLGLPLREQASAQDALSALHLLLDVHCSLSHAARLLRSPYWRSAESEFIARQRLELKMRELRMVEFDLAFWLRLLEQAELKPEGWSCPGLKHGLQTARQARQPATALPSYWRSCFSEMLAALGWPGEHAPGSDEYQALQAWRELLGDFGRLDSVLGAISAQTALSRLERMAGERIFQPEQPESPVEVLGLLQISGLHYDALRVVGLDDRVWPPPVRPLPFLPPHIQRQLGMPNASPQSARLFAEAILRQVQASSRQIIFSSPRREEDLELRPSPLLVGLEERREVIASDGWLFAPQWNRQNSLEWAPELPLPATGKERGGAQIFKAQAQCPFRGFAEFRLGAETFQLPELGWDRRDQGTLAHRFLELAWKKLVDSDGLIKAINEGHLLGILDECRQELQAKLDSHDAISLVLSQLELARLSLLIHDWMLKVEAQRPWFRVIHVEKKMEAELAGIRFNLRVDRLDELEDGRRILLDYKTGQPLSINVWEQERPDEPQLPLYAIAMPPPTPAGLAFAYLRPDEFKLRGRGEGAGLPDGIKPEDLESWQARLQAWRKTLTKLAGDFNAGIALLKPKYGENTCDECHLHPLCRVRENGCAEESLEQAEGDDA